MAAFRRIADELDPNHVPDWALRYRRPVPAYAAKLLSVFGLRWLPRIGLVLVLAGTAGLIAGMVAFAARAWVISGALVSVSLASTIVGSVFWTAYRMRHWLPGGAGSEAPSAPPVERSMWLWMWLAAAAAWGGCALMLWLMVSSGTARGALLGAGIFFICAGSASATFIKYTDRISPGRVKLLGWPAGRVSLIFLGAGVFLGATLLLQVPFLTDQPGTR